MNASRFVWPRYSLAFVGSGGAATGQQPAPAGVPDLSGGWLRLDSGSGSFDGTAAKTPPAELTAAGKAMVVRGDGRNVITPEMLKSTKANEAGQPYVVLSGGLHGRRHGRQLNQSELDRAVHPAIEGRSPDGPRGPREPALLHGWPPASGRGAGRAEHVRPFNRAV